MQLPTTSPLYYLILANVLTILLFLWPFNYLNDNIVLLICIPHIVQEISCAYSAERLIFLSDNLCSLLSVFHWCNISLSSISVRSFKFMSKTPCNSRVAHVKELKLSFYCSCIWCPIIFQPLCHQYFRPCISVDLNVLGMEDKKL